MKTCTTCARAFLAPGYGPGLHCSLVANDPGSFWDSVRAWREAKPADWDCPGHTLRLLPAVEGEPSILEASEGLYAFGNADYSRDGEVLWSFDMSDEDAPTVTVADVEALAAADPDHDWRISFETPLWDGEYQRHGPGQWVLVRKGPGFA